MPGAKTRVSPDTAGGCGFFLLFFFFLGGGFFFYFFFSFFYLGFFYFFYFWMASPLWTMFAKWRDRPASSGRTSCLARNSDSSNGGARFHAKPTPGSGLEWRRLLVSGEPPFGGRSSPPLFRTRAANRGLSPMQRETSVPACLTPSSCGVSVILFPSPWPAGDWGRRMLIEKPFLPRFVSVPIHGPQSDHAIPFRRLGGAGLVLERGWRVSISPLPRPAGLSARPRLRLSQLYFGHSAFRRRPAARWRDGVFSLDPRFMVRRFFPARSGLVIASGIEPTPLRELTAYLPAKSVSRFIVTFQRPEMLVRALWPIRSAPAYRRCPPCPSLGVAPPVPAPTFWPGLGAKTPR